MTAAALIDAGSRRALVSGCHPDPFSELGPRRGRLLVLAPGVLQVQVLRDGARQSLSDLGDGLYGGPAPGAPEGWTPASYQLALRWPDGEQVGADPYAFGLLLSEADLRALADGSWRASLDCLGARLDIIEGVAGLRCAVWAPNARRVAVVGDFNGWDPRRHGMRLRHAAGVWEIFLPGVSAGARYKYALTDAAGRTSWKADPAARQAEPAPATASIVTPALVHDWTDQAWTRERAARQASDGPMSIYEVHAGSWLPPDGGGCTWDQLGARLPDYARAMGFTHIELLPIMEHPFGGSWGYQPLGLYAPAARYGPPAAFARFVDRCHAAGIGVILDWVPAHFPDDPHGLARYDGTALYEHEDPREGRHPDWHTAIYNLGRAEVRAFLIASALFWLRQFHVDGLRVDAVASMLYRDYSRGPGLWVPNIEGGRENFEAIAFLRELNATVREQAPGALVIAEESTAWHGVTAPAEAGGLGFDYKWNMGWMHDTLRYLARDPVHRKYHHGDMTFGMAYAYSERFVLALSHDEVVHGKGSLLAKMPGDAWQRHANLRAYLGFMWAHPGKKLLFMGGELAMPDEWNHDRPLDWSLLDQTPHRGAQRLLRDLNACLRGLPSLHRRDHEPDGFAWVIATDAGNSVLAFLRLAPDARPVLVISNFTPMIRRQYRVGVPQAGFWREVLNTDAEFYGGSHVGNLGGVAAERHGEHGLSHCLTLTLPPLATLYLQPED